MNDNDNSSVNDDDENGVSPSSSPSSSSNLTSLPAPMAISSGASDDRTFGPVPTADLLPWLSAPNGKKTYINSIEIAAGRKEMWHKTIQDPHRKRQLVDSLWMYICDAEAQAQLVEKQAVKQYLSTKRNSEEFTHWIKKMRDGGVEEFFNWPDPNESSVAERRDAQEQQKQLPQDELIGLEKGTTTATKELSIVDQQQLDAKLLSKLNRKRKEFAQSHGVSVKSYREMTEDISENTPLAPYEDLPFLKMRMHEDPSSLDPALKEWAEQNLDMSDVEANIKKTQEIDEKDEETGKEGREEAEDIHHQDVSSQGVVSELGGRHDDGGLQKSIGEGNNGVLATTTPTPPTKLSPEEKARKRLASRLRQSEILNRLYMKTKKRVKMSKVTYDDEGVYFHVMPKTVTQAAFDNDTDNNQQNQNENENRRSTTLSSDDDDHSTPIDSIIYDGKFTSSTKKSMGKSFFKPKMVKASDNTSRGVVKIDWPTVRAAYAGKRKTDYSREDQAAAKERIIRLCRGEDPNTM